MKIAVANGIYLHKMNDTVGYLYTKNYATFTIQTAEGRILKEFSGAVAAGKALCGDTVNGSTDGCTLISRTDHPQLVGILELNTKVRHGFTDRGVPLYLFLPSNEAYPPMLVASKETARENCLAVAAFEHWDGDTTFPRGGLVRILGLCGDIDTEKLAVGFQHSPWSWSKKTTPEELIYPSREGRHVIDKPTINIDPKGCMDIDDTVSLWKEGNHWNLAINIADVAAFVALNPALNFAEKIGQTLYTNKGRAVRPMFPARFSEDAFSLLPGEERFCISLMAKWDGQKLHMAPYMPFKETVVRNWGSYTYESCFNTTEIDISVLMKIVDSLGYDSADPHKWVECLMVLYNTKMAEHLKIAGAGLLRTHDAPSKEKLIHIEALGLPAKELAYPAAVYSTTDAQGGHWGLEKGIYCHATSPIRRYADILNQHVLKTLMNSGVQTPTIYSNYALTLNRTDKSAKAYGRDLMFIECVLGAPGIPVYGIVIEQKEKTSIYIETWKRIIRCYSKNEYKPGDQVIVGFYANKLGRSWKKKMVYQIERV